MFSIDFIEAASKTSDGINWALSREMVDLWAKYLHVFRMKHVKCFCTLVLQFTTLKSRFFLFATWTTNITNRWEIPQFQDCKYTCIVFLRFFPIILCTTNDEPIFHFYLFVIATHLLTKVTRNFLCASDARDEMKFDGNNRKKTDFHSFSHAQYESFCTNRYEMIPRTCFTQKSETEQKRTKLLNTNRILTLLQLPNSLISRQLKQCGWKKRTYWRAKKRNNTISHSRLFWV